MAEQNVSEGSLEAVAFRLMTVIAQSESGPTERDAREYYLTLYDECRRTVKSGRSVGSSSGSRRGAGYVEID